MWNSLKASPGTKHPALLCHCVVKQSVYYTNVLRFKSEKDENEQLNPNRYHTTKELHILNGSRSVPVCMCQHHMQMRRGGSRCRGVGGVVYRVRVKMPLTQLASKVCDFQRELLLLLQGLLSLYRGEKKSRVSLNCVSEPNCVGRDFSHVWERNHMEWLT